QRHVAAVSQVGRATDPLEVEVADVGAEVGEAPGAPLVVTDDDARQPGEGEAGDVERAGGADGAAVQPRLVPDARDAGAQVRVVGQQRLGGGGPAGRGTPR